MSHILFSPTYVACDLICILNLVCSEWNLRKSAAASLDNLASALGENLFQCLLPQLQTSLNSDDWVIKESGILALGAVAEGCWKPLQPYLPSFVPMLVTYLHEGKASHSFFSIDIVLPYLSQFLI